MHNKPESLEANWFDIFTDKTVSKLTLPSMKEDGSMGIIATMYFHIANHYREYCGYRRSTSKTDR